MTTIQITIPDDLAKTARDAGLLDSEAIQGMLLQQLRSQALDKLRQAWKAMPSRELSHETEAEIVDAVRRCRAEMRAERGER
jgi:post-segregation antitoxin (ccd killing protein)